MQENLYWVYILSNWNNSVLYVGMTGNLEKRLIEHRTRVNPDCFTAKYNCMKCVFFETTNNSYSALEREKQIKRWNRAKKDWLIGKNNPEWKELVA